MSNDQISINNLSKVYDNGFEALKNINLNIKRNHFQAQITVKKGVANSCLTPGPTHTV